VQQCSEAFDDSLVKICNLAACNDKSLGTKLKAFWMVKIKHFLQQQQNLTLDTAIITAEEATKKQRLNITLVTNNNVFTFGDEQPVTQLRYSLVAGVDHIKVTASSAQPYISNVN